MNVFIKIALIFRYFCVIYRIVLVGRVFFRRVMVVMVLEIVRVWFIFVVVWEVVKDKKGYISLEVVIFLNKI